MPNAQCQCKYTQQQLDGNPQKDAGGHLGPEANIRCLDLNVCPSKSQQLHCLVLALVTAAGSNVDLEEVFTRSRRHPHIQFIQLEVRSSRLVLSELARMCNNVGGC